LSRHRANIKRQFKYVSLTDEPFALALPPGLQSTNPGVPPPIDVAPEGSIPWSSLDLTSTLLIDARTPKEYALDHIRGAINIPVLSDLERLEIGKIFTSGNTLEARLRGARFACTNIANYLEPQKPLSLLLDTKGHSDSSRLFLVYCARGGQRSTALATILAELDLPTCEVACLAGGYRAWRRVLLRQLEAWPTLMEPGGLSGTLWVLSGLTGCGKTLLLNGLEEAGESTLNLEGMAKHKGSMFGKSTSDKQLNQRSFEAVFHDALKRCLDAPVVWTECESRNVGPSCQLGGGFWRRLRGTQSTVRVWLDVPIQARVSWILEDYADWLENSEARQEWVFKSLETYHGKRRLESWRTMARSRDYDSLVTELLVYHYDPLYRKSRGPMLRTFADAGLLHRIDLPLIDRKYLRREIIPRLIELSRGSNDECAHQNPIFYPF
uniref:Rhodanese domain-containing protein n=1 Tax=Mesocestoides corti TaxID=53468 RepID=A0A0R3UN53_MESCO